MKNRKFKTVKKHVPIHGEWRTIRKFVICRTINGKTKWFTMANIRQQFEKWDNQNYPSNIWVDKHWW